MPGMSREADPSRSPLSAQAPATGSGGPELPALAPFLPMDPAPAPHWAAEWQARIEPTLHPATPAPLATLAAEPAPPVPQLLIRRQLQLIETYEAAPEPEAVAPTPAADQPPSAPPASGATPAGNQEQAVPDPDRAELLRELEVTRSELAELSLLVEELPAIFESKFRQRLEPILAEQSRLLADNELLRQQLQALPGSAIAARPLLLPEVVQSPPRRRRRRSGGLSGAFRRAFGLSDRDDGRTRAA